VSEDDKKLESIISVFNELFKGSEKVILCGGFEEPFYKAPKGSQLGEIQFTRNYISSALHEISHWCIAGENRRKLDDFGYWYEPDGRNAKQQKAFYDVESMPQAYECCLSLACKIEFNLSADNLDGDGLIDYDFKHKVITNVENYFNGLYKGRILLLINAYLNFFWPNQSNELMVEKLKNSFIKLRKKF
jgi:elongation factor P hydroxylase